MRKIEICPSVLSGSIDIPPSKSMSHRAVIAAALAEGESEIGNVVLSEDVSATIEAIRTLGGKIEIQKDDLDTNRMKLRINGHTIWKDRKPVRIDCKESGSTLRFLIPIVMQLKNEVTFEGREGLAKRPLTEYYRIFEQDGVAYQNKEGRLPLTIRGTLRGGAYHLKGDVSSQFISGLMMALPILLSDSEIILSTKLESASYVRMTKQVLSEFGIRIQDKPGVGYTVSGGQKYLPQQYRIEGDYSQAAFWLAAGAISRGKGFLECSNLRKDSLQGDRKILDILTEMGANYFDTAEGVRIEAAALRAVDIDASDIPDLVPILAVALSVSEGRSRIYNATRLRWKESDRIEATVKGLLTLGAKIREVGDEIHIIGQPMLEGGTVDSFSDHRIAMAMTIASTVCRDRVILEKAETVSKSYPHFFEDFESLGGIYRARE